MALLNNGADYEHINLYNSSFAPSTVHSMNTGLTRFFASYLIQRIFGVYDITMPEHWDENYTRYCLFGIGYVAVIRTNKFGIIPQECTLGGFNVFYQPSKALIANPLLQSRELRIGVDCGMMRLQPVWKGVMDIVMYFADQMALTAEACGINTLNSKLSFLFLTDSKTAAQSYKKMYDNYASGEPLVVSGKDDLFDKEDGERFSFFNNDVAGSYIVDKLQAALRQWELMFDSYIGIPNNPVNKKERVTTVEVNSNNIESHVLADVWLHCMEQSFDRVNNLFGEQLLSVKYRYGYDLTGGLETARR